MDADTAYVYGFWLADGHMRISRSYRIYFSSADKNHLEKINELFDSNYRVTKHKRLGCYELLLMSKQAYLDLQKIGGRTAKSTSIIFPNIPENLYPDIIRGYFDGDGSVYKISYRATKNNKIYSEIRSNFTSGSKRFLESIKNILEKHVEVNKRIVCQYGENQYKLAYAQKDTFKLLNYIYYPDHNLSLERKRKYLSVLKNKFQANKSPLN